MEDLLYKDFAYNLKSQTINVNNEPVILTLEDIQATALWFADNAQGCIDEAVSGKVFVNDIQSYKASKQLDIQNYLTGNFIPWLGFWQKAIYLKTGSSVPLLS
jgi:hypothetical protein